MDLITNRALRRTSTGGHGIDLNTHKVYSGGNHQHLMQFFQDAAGTIAYLLCLAVSPEASIKCVRDTQTPRFHCRYCVLVVSACAVPSAVQPQPRSPVGESTVRSSRRSKSSRLHTLHSTGPPSGPTASATNTTAGAGAAAGASAGDVIAAHRRPYASVPVSHSRAGYASSLTSSPSRSHAMVPTATATATGSSSAPLAAVAVHDIDSDVAAAGLSDSVNTTAGGELASSLQRVGSPMNAQRVIATNAHVIRVCYMGDHVTQVRSWLLYRSLVTDSHVFLSHCVSTSFGMPREMIATRTLPPALQRVGIPLRSVRSCQRCPLPLNTLHHFHS
jgi:hypothetical protein